MKVIIYTLNADGTIPNQILNGGYFPKANQNESPQDFDLVGIVSDETSGDGLTLDALTEYVESFMPVFTNPMTEETKTAAEVVNAWWQLNVEA